MGDTKQLPPTSFFDVMIQKTDDINYELSSGRHGKYITPM